MDDVVCKLKQWHYSFLSSSLSLVIPTTPIRPIDTYIHSSPNPKLTPFPKELQFLLPSLQIPSPHHPDPRRLLLRQRAIMLKSHVVVRLQHHLHRRLLR